MVGMLNIVKLDLWEKATEPAIDGAIPPMAESISNLE